MIGSTTVTVGLDAHGRPIRVRRFVPRSCWKSGRCPYAASGSIVTRAACSSSMAPLNR